VNALRIFLVGGVTSYRALFNWISPWVFFPHMLGYPIFEILFFAYLGRFADAQSDKFFLVGNAFMAIAITGFFGMGHAIGGERRSQTLATLLASPANRLALFLGRAVPAIATGIVVAAISFALGALILGVAVDADTVAQLALAVLVSAFACTGLGLCIGALGLRGRNVTLFADSIGGAMLLVAGANVPLDRLPGWIQALSSVIPVTHGIEAARAVADGATIAAAGDLLLQEALLGLVYRVLGLTLLRLFELEGRRSATLETF